MTFVAVSFLAKQDFSLDASYIPINDLNNNRD